MSGLSGFVGIMFIAIILLVFAILPLGSIITGVVFVALPNRRQKLVDEFNYQIYRWEHDYLPLMQTYNPKRINISTGVPFDFQDQKHIRMSKLRSKYDKPQISDWNVSYFASFADYGSFHFDPDTPPLEDVIRLPNDTVKVKNKPFVETSHTFYTDSDDSNENEDDIDEGDENSSYRTAKEKCHEHGGTYEFSWSGPNCFWYYRLGYSCILMDPKTSSVDHISPHTDSAGCYWKVYFSYGARPNFATGKYYTTNEKNWQQFIVATEVRSVHDPEVVLSRMTEGGLDFGWSKFTWMVVGFSLIGGGAVWGGLSLGFWAWFLRKMTDCDCDSDCCSVLSSWTRRRRRRAYRPISNSYSRRNKQYPSPGDVETFINDTLSVNRAGGDSSQVQQQQQQQPKIDSYNKPYNEPSHFEQKPIVFSQVDSYVPANDAPSSTLPVYSRDLSKTLQSPDSPMSQPSAPTFPRIQGQGQQPTDNNQQVDNGDVKYQYYV